MLVFRKRFKDFILLFLLCFSGSLFAQQQGSLTVHKDSRLDLLLEKHKDISAYEESIDGFRVQIFFDSGNNSQRNANKARASFLSRYPDVDVYITFETPYYKVRVGDFRTRLEARKFLNQIQSNYSNAFIVRDNIKYPRLNLPVE